MALAVLREQETVHRPVLEHRGEDRAAQPGTTPPSGWQARPEGATERRRMQGNAALGLALEVLVAGRRGRVRRGSTKLPCHPLSASRGSLGGTELMPVRLVRVRLSQPAASDRLATARACDVGPAVVAAWPEDVDLVVGLGAALGLPEDPGGTEAEALRVAVAAGEDVAAHTLDLGVVAPDRAIKPHAQDLALAGRPVGRLDLFLGGKSLGLERIAEAGEPVGALLARDLVEHPVGADRETAAVVVAAGMGARGEPQGLAQGLGGLVVAADPSRQFRVGREAGHAR